MRLTEINQEESKSRFIHKFSEVDEESSADMAATNADGSDLMESNEVFSIVILKSKMESMRQAETYLKNRKWTVWTTLNIREILMIVIQKKPQFVMISSDHPNKKVRTLPKLLASAFPVKIVAFNEAQSPSSMRSLQDMKIAHSLYYPVSGPMIERLVLKIKKEEDLSQQIAEEQRMMGINGPDAAKADGSNLIMFKGEAGNDKDMQIAIAQARATLKDMLSSKDEDSTNSDSSSGFNSAAALKANESKAADSFGNVSSGSASSPGSSFSPSSAQGFGSAGVDVRKEGAGAAGFGSAASSSTSNAKNKPLSQQTKPNQAGSGYSPIHQNSSNKGQVGYKPDDPNASDPSSGSFADYEEKMRQKEHFAEQEKARKANAASDAISPTENSNSEGSRSAKKDKSVPNFESGPRKKKITPTYKRDPSLQRGDNESIIVRGTQHALDESVSQSEEQTTYDPLTTKIYSSCLIVESKRFSGYLLTSMNRKRNFDSNFIDLVRSRLFNFLKEHGEIPNEESNSMDLKLEEVEFEDWANEHADFLRKSIHNGSEVAMAFFPNKDLYANLQESVSEKMLQLSLSELKEDAPVEFDLFIYMPENNKFLLYTPEGRPLYGQQRTRLIEKGITHLHLRRESAASVKRYRAQNFLNEKINDFKTSQKKKS